MWFHAGRKTYYTRLVVPRKLLPLLRGRVEFWKSLRTTDRSKAKLRAATFESKGRRLFLYLQRHGVMMQPDQIKSLVAEWINSELERAEQAKADGGTNELEDAEDYKDVYGTLLEEADEARQMNQQWKVKDLALELTTRHGLQIEPESSEFGRLCFELLKGKVELLREEIRRMDGEYRQPAGSQSHPVATQATVPTITKPFSVVFEKYLAENKERQPRTQSQIRSGFMKFLMAIGGDKLVGDITREDGRT